jgi:S1-C subfamily serine protease
MRCFVFILLMACQAFGQSPHVCKIETPDAGVLTGVCIGTLDGEQLIATCAHGWAAGEKPEATINTHYTAVVLQIDKKLDVAVLKSAATLTPVAIGNTPLPSDRVTSEGFPRGEFATKQGSVELFFNSGNYQCGFASQPGHSGGPVYFEGKLVGLVYGGPGDFTKAAVIPVAAILRVSSLARHTR